MFVYSVRLVYDGFRPGMQRKNGGKGVQLRLVKHKRGLPLRIVQGAAPADASVLDGSHRYGTHPPLRVPYIIIILRSAFTTQDPNTFYRWDSWCFTSRFFITFLAPVSFDALVVY